MQELIDSYGWAYECGHCFKQVDKLIEQRCYDAFGLVYCHQSCRSAAQAPGLYSGRFACLDK